MGCGNLVLAHDVRVSREVLAGTGLLRTKEEGSLAAQLEQADREGSALRAEAASACRGRIATHYSRDKAARDYERYFLYVSGEAPDWATRSQGPLNYMDRSSMLPFMQVSAT